MTVDDLSLQEAAEALGLHYMTVYRYVRTGRLPATQVSGEWRIRRADLSALSRRPKRRARTGGASVGRVSRLLPRLVAGDEPGSWSIVEDAMVAGLDPVDIHVDLLARAMRRVGDLWAVGELRVDEEHRATAVATRVVSRLGPRFSRPGRTRGAVILAGAPDDPHALPVSLAADVVRSAGFTVVDLGASVPAEYLGRAVLDADRLVGVAICVSVEGRERSVRRAVDKARLARDDVPVLVGGWAAGTDSEVFRADGVGSDARSLLRLLDGSTAS